jgi:DNA-binding CsgD family transcriptional regulator
MRVDYRTYKEISKRLDIEVWTVRAHMNAIMRKFDARSAGELYRRARLMGVA